MASTGAAISGLSGPAAESALLAFLGGGSLASGGGGMALGGAALNIVVAGPALLVGGLVFKGRTTKKVTRAKKYEADVAVAIAELDKTDALPKSVDNADGDLDERAGNLTIRYRPLIEETQDD